jgi:hypothetical protein
MPTELTKSPLGDGTVMALTVQVMEEPTGRFTIIFISPFPFAPDVQVQVVLAESILAEKEPVSDAPVTPEGLEGELETRIVYWIDEFGL